MGQVLHQDLFCIVVQPFLRMFHYKLQREEFTFRTFLYQDFF